MEELCPHCGAALTYIANGRTYSKVIGVEYPYGDPNRYDGVSEWMFPCCGTRQGRWSGRILKEGESEPRFGGRFARSGAADPW